MGRVAGWLLMGIGALHVLLFLWWGAPELKAVADDGFFDAIDPDRDRQMIFWSLSFGVMGFFLGQLISWVEAQGRQAPGWVGWELLTLAVIGAALMPVSGWWLVMVPAVLILVGSRRAPHPA